MFIDIPREDSAFALKYTYLDLDFDVQHKLGNALYAGSVRIRFVILGLNAFFRKVRLTSSSGKEIEE